MQANDTKSGLVVELLDGATGIAARTSQRLMGAVDNNTRLLVLWRKSPSGASGGAGSDVHPLGRWAQAAARGVVATRLRLTLCVCVCVCV